MYCPKKVCKINHLQIIFLGSPHWLSKNLPAGLPQGRLSRQEIYPSRFPEYVVFTPPCFLEEKIDSILKCCIVLMYPVLFQNSTLIPLVALSLVNKYPNLGEIPSLAYNLTSSVTEWNNPPTPIHDWSILLAKWPIPCGKLTLLWKNHHL